MTLIQTQWNNQKDQGPATRSIAKTSFFKPSGSKLTVFKTNFGDINESLVANHGSVVYAKGTNFVMPSQVTSPNRLDDNGQPDDYRQAYGVENNMGKF